LVSEWETAAGRECEAARRRREALAKAEADRVEKEEAARPRPQWYLNRIAEQKASHRAEIVKLLSGGVPPDAIIKIHGTDGVENVTFPRLAVNELVAEWQEQRRKPPAS
jgi:hypothetical protein